MEHVRNTKALNRTMILAAAIIVVIGGVTFAALQSQQDKLTGNTIQTATASLKLSRDGTTYSDSAAGFDFSNLIPGGPAVPVNGYSFYLKNSGGTALSLKLAVTSVPSNLDHVDLAKINVILLPVGFGPGNQTFTLDSLIASATDGGLPLTSGNLASGATQQYRFQVSMSSDAISGSGAMLGNIDFAFSGTAATN